MWSKMSSLPEQEMVSLAAVEYFHQKMLKVIEKSHDFMPTKLSSDETIIVWQFTKEVNTFSTACWFSPIFGSRHSD